MSKKIKLPQEWPGVYYIDSREINAVSRVLKARSPFRLYGPNLLHEADKFEKELSAYIGRGYCLGVSSGTGALQVCLSAMGVGPGDEVIVPGYFWVSTVGAVVRSGAIPVLADVDDSFSLDPEDLRKKITGRTKAVIVVHMGGVIGQIGKIVSICRKRKIRLLEDCAQSAGASVKGKMAGSFGDMAMFSFQLNKNMTSGEGGAIVTNNRSLYMKANAIHDLGYPRDEKGRLISDDKDCQLWGIGYRMNEMVAAVLRVQLSKLPKITGEMRRFKNSLKVILSRYDDVRTRTVADPGGDSGAFLKMTFKDEQTAWAFKDGLIGNGIRVRDNGLYPIHMTEWGFHIYYNNGSLVNKNSICGHHSVWDLKENEFARNVSYAKGTLKHLDDIVERTVIFCIASKLSGGEKKLIRYAFTKTCKDIGLKRKDK